MCGIYGVYARDASACIEPEWLTQMGQILTCRGPDDQGSYLDDRVALGHRRLSIVDIEGGHQPLSNESESVWLTYNGEIYNYQELNENLIKKNHAITTNCDSETLVHLYEEEGVAGLNKINGMFAFALWDKNNDLFCLARDRLGIKPLYYYYDDKYLAFASELKALACLPFIEMEIDNKIIDTYLTFLYIPAPFTSFKGIKRLMPGEYLKASGQEIVCEKYWQVPLKPVLSKNNKQQLAEELFQRLKDSVERRLMSDVPLGVFLSGGLDSSALVVAMHELGVEEINTFSMGFGSDKKYNEIDYARKVSNMYNTKHFELETTPDIKDILPKIIARFDEPLADPAAIPLYHLSQFAASKVKVVLCGDGGDELLGGYRRYLWDKTADNYHKLPTLIRSLIRNGLKVLPARTSGPGNLVRLGKKFTERAELSPHLRYASWFSVFSTAYKERCYQSDYLAGLSGSNPNCFFEKVYDKYEGEGLVNRLNYVDLQTYLPYNLLEKIDRITMAHSLEARVPFLDHNLVEWCMSLPADVKMSTTGTKKILRQALQGKIPQEIRTRKKMGFGVPLETWFKGEWFEYAKQIVLDSQGVVGEITNREALENMFEDHKQGRANNSWHIYALMVLEIWQQNNSCGKIQ